MGPFSFKPPLQTRQCRCCLRIYLLTEQMNAWEPRYSPPLWRAGISLHSLKSGKSSRSRETQGLLRPIPDSKLLICCTQHCINHFLYALFNLNSNIIITNGKPSLEKWIHPNSDWLSQWASKFKAPASKPKLSYCTTGILWEHLPVRCSDAVADAAGSSAHSPPEYSWRSLWRVPPVTSLLLGKMDWKGELTVRLSYPFTEQRGFNWSQVP